MPLPCPIDEPVLPLLLRDPAPRACTMCDHSERTGIELMCTCPAVVNGAGQIPVALARSTSCGPDARYLRFPGLA